MTDSILRKKIAGILYKIGMTANSLTLLGLALAGAAGWYAYEGKFYSAALLLLISGLLDMMDGAVARLSGKADAFGGILDSALDRYGDAFVLGGILFYCTRTDHEFYAGLAFAALAGSFAISYVRARAECEIDSCRVGFWERGERIGLLVIMMAAHNVGTGLMILAISVQWTALERLLEARRLIRDASAQIRPALNRTSVVYAVQVLFWAGIAVFFRLPF